MFWFYIEILIFVLFHLLLCLNQRLQIFHNDGFEVFHSFFLLRETKELAAEYSEGFWLLANTHRSFSPQTC